MVEVAELLQAGVIDQYQRLNFPPHHRLNQSLNPRAALASADLVLSLATRGPLRHVPCGPAAPSVEGDLGHCQRSVSQEQLPGFQRFNETDLAIAADAEATLPYLLEAIKRLMTADRRIAFEARGAKLAEASGQALEQAQLAATYGWDASPITTARLTAEVWGPSQE
jgi:acetolactate synthase-1/2/3 large subunit